MQFLKVHAKEAKEIDPQHRDWPENSIILFAKNGSEEIVGQIAVIAMPHIEGLEIKEGYGFLLPKLLEEAEEVLRSLGRNCAISYINSIDIKTISQAIRLGYQWHPFGVFIKDLTK